MLLTPGAHLYGFLIASYGFIKFFLFIQFIPLLFDCPCLVQCGLHVCVSVGGGAGGGGKET